jgi:predicted nucleic acid-binding protein
MGSPSVKISAALAGVSRLFVETTPFIYFVLRNPIYVDRVRAILAYVDAGTIQAFSSTVTLRLRATYNLKTPDALQVAAALHAGCDIFLTNDFGIKRVKEIHVLVLDDLELDIPPTSTV